MVTIGRPGISRGDRGQHLAVHVSAVVALPLLQPVEVAGAEQRVVPQDPEEEEEESFISIGKTRRHHTKHASAPLSVGGEVT
ncbi:hypothetical protein EYF80_004292 [Liparis tanakae]|uniref:Uncharacterized protein n=1 Tax=Liparis tanakae TaxID=230148 RepID=A0A4Z2J630_9TELE|nr:hypothetical protein EYF80_004292 [Liparis tanakae]